MRVFTLLERTNIILALPNEVSTKLMAAWLTNKEISFKDYDFLAKKVHEINLKGVKL